MDVSIFIKSHFRGNPRGAGEAAAIVEYIDKKGNTHTRQLKIEVGEDTKNSLMLQMCNTAVELLLKPCTITIHINCPYIANAHKFGWVSDWEQLGWAKATGKELANAEQWKRFQKLMQMHTVTFASYTDNYDAELEKILNEGGRQ